MQWARKIPLLSLRTRISKTRKQCRRSSPMIATCPYQWLPSALDWFHLRPCLESACREDRSQQQSADLICLSLWHQLQVTTSWSSKHKDPPVKTPGVLVGGRCHPRIQVRSHPAMLSALSVRRRKSHLLQHGDRHPVA